MLDNSTLSQLKQLKQEIVDSKEYAEGIVKGTQRKFGFIVLDDGREIYLNPEEMQKVLPGDRVKILIVTEQDKTKNKDSKAKTSAALQALLHSPLNEFTGRYIIKGQGHFVEPDLPYLNRWIFIPPAARQNAQAGDYVRCKISRHPYPKAKPQAKILEVIGAAEQIGIEADYVISKFQLAPEWPDNWQDSLLSLDTADRTDLTATSFITIDAASTQDMDDALYAQPTEKGWQLQVAIADPSALIAPDSTLDKLAKQRATSSYLPGKAIAMLPEELANNLCSLTPDQVRAALICQIDILKDGSIESFKFFEAIIRSHGKLTYNDVSAFLDPATSSPTSCSPHSTTLSALHALSNALLENRTECNLVIPNRQDYRMILNAQRKLERIELQHKNCANQLVEECMIAANRCAAEILGEQGVFISHPGFRPERLADVRKLAEEQLGLTDIDFSTPDGYRQLMKSIDDDALEFPLRAVLSRLLARSRLSTQRLPHQGMGLSAYTTFTSPIRKYSDLVVHRLIKAKLQTAATEHTPACSEDDLAIIQQGQDNARQARMQMEQWLKCDFIQPMIGQQLSGHVSQINSNGFTVRLDQYLIEGFVETRLLNDKYSFDPMRLRLSSKNLTIELEQAIDVIIKDVDSNRRSISFTLPAAVTSPKETVQTKTAQVS
ncbi:MAG: VacB/RNase II family 3'-5' exoribonuclease [Spongiibacteraceae bacterium]